MLDQQSWWEEKRSAYLYLVMAKNERHPLRKNLFLKLAQAANEQAVLWEKKINAPSTVLTFKPDLRTRFIAFLLPLTGPEKIRYFLSAMKIRGMSVFSDHNHETMHRGINTAGNIRAAIFGVNDGLISNMSLILGMAGANANNHIIVLAGLAGALAGAFSMAAGEYVSMSSQKDVFQHQIDLERSELELYPEEELEELALIYQARGIPKEYAFTLAECLIKNPVTALDTLAREELGLNPDELGSPIGAMLFSFFSFGIGAAVPLIPFLFSVPSLKISLVFTAIALFSIGALASLFSNQNAWKGGAKMLLIGCAAGLMTFMIGRWVGVAAL